MIDSGPYTRSTRPSLRTPFLSPRDSDSGTRVGGTLSCLRPHSSTRRTRLRPDVSYHRVEDGTIPRTTGSDSARVGVELVSDDQE